MKKMTSLVLLMLCFPGYGAAMNNNVPSDLKVSENTSHTDIKMLNPNVGNSKNEGLQITPEVEKQYRLAAEKGDAVAQFNLGLMYAEGVGTPKNDVEGAKWYRLAADQGLAEAQLNLGVMYYNGKGVPKDFNEATKLYRLAAEQGLPEAQFNLGNSYSHGEGVSQNNTEALKWFRKAAEQGSADAQNNLGLMYAQGNGVPRDLVTAYMWCNLSAEQGNPSAMGARDTIAKYMTAAEITEAQKLTQQWKNAHHRD